MQSKHLAEISQWGLTHSEGEFLFAYNCIFTRSFYIFHTFVPWRQILLFSRCTICIVHCFHNIKLSLVADHRSGLMWMHCINWSGLIWVEKRVFWHRKEFFSSISCFQKAFLDDMLFSPFLANILGKLYFEQTLLTKLCTSVYFTCSTTLASFSSTA